MARRAVWNPKTGRYEPVGGSKNKPNARRQINVMTTTRPNAIWNPIEGRYIPTDMVKVPKYSLDEALTLSKQGYTGLFKVGSKRTVGLLGSPWQQYQALMNLRGGKPIPEFQYDTQASKRTLMDIQAAQPITFQGGLYNNILNLRQEFYDRYGPEGEKYTRRWGLPKITSKYGVLFNLNNKKVRQNDSMITYQRTLAEQARNTGKAMLNPNTGDAEKDTIITMRAQELIAIGNEYKPRRNRWSATRIQELQNSLMIGDEGNWDPQIQKAMGIQAPPKDWAAAQAANTSMNSPFAQLYGSQNNKSNIARDALSKMEAAAGSSLLAAETVDEDDNLLDIVGKTFSNSAKSLARIAVGLPVGMVAVADSFAESAKNLATGDFKTDEETWNGIDTRLLNGMKDDYTMRYKTPFDSGVDSMSSWQKFGGEFVKDPVMPILDVLAVVPVVGWIAKGAGIASTAAKIGRAGKWKLTPEGERRVAVAEQRVAKFEDEGVEVISPEDLPGIQEQLRTMDVKSPEYKALRDRVSYTAAIARLDEIVSANTRLTARKYNQLARRALNNDEAAKARLEDYRRKGLLVPDGADSRIIRFGAKFEDRVIVLDRPRNIEELSDNTKLVYRRLPGSPLARGASNTLTFLARMVESQTTGAKGETTQISRVADVVTQLPGIGLQWQYSRALKARLTSDMWDAISSLSGLSAEMIKLASEDKIGAPMERAILSTIRGGDGAIAVDDPSFQRRILQNQLDELDAQIDKVRDEGLPVEESLKRRGDIQARLDAIPSDADYMAARSRLLDRIADPDAHKGDVELDLAMEFYHRGIRLEARKDRIVNAETDTLTFNYLKMLFAEPIKALRLLPEDLFGDAGELKGMEDRVMIVNGDYPLFETQFDGPDSWRHIRDESGINVFEKIEDADDRAARINDWNEGLGLIRDGGVFRDARGTGESAGGPVFILAEDVSGFTRSSDFIAVHRLRLNGVMQPDGPKRSSILNESEVLILPKELFLEPKKKLSKDEARLTVEAGALNAMAEFFPNAKFYSDKVTEAGITGEAANFADISTEQIVARNGLKAHTLSMYAQSAQKFAKNRYEKDISGIIESNAELIPLSALAGRQGSGYRILKHVRVFSDPEEAMVFARERNVIKEVSDAFDNESAMRVLSSPFDDNIGVGKMTRNGETLYVVRGDIRDWSRVVQEEEASRLKNYSEYQRVLYENFESIPDSSNTYVLAVPESVDRVVKSVVVEGNDYASKLLNQPLVKGPTNVFKRLVLNMNPRFIGTNVIGGMAMMMMHNPLIAAKILTRAMQQAARRSGTEEWYNIVRDGNVIEYHLAYELERNIYRLELGQRARENITLGGKLSRYGWNGGYTTVAAFEKFVRKAVAKEFLDSDPAFKDFMSSAAVDNYIARGTDFRGLPSENITRFEAAADLLLDPLSPYYDAKLAYRMRYTTNTVSGNYHSFGPTEQLMRNMLMPFYAWQRHSLAYTWRMPIDKPINALAIGVMGGYGYNRALEMGLPDWMWQTVPMPDFMKEALGLDGEDYRIDLGAISPFGTPADMSLAALNLFTGEDTTSNVFNFTNPYFNAMLKSATGFDAFRGEVAYDRQGFIDNLKDAANNTPGIRIPKDLIFENLNRAYQDDGLANKYRSIENAEDILKNMEAGDRFSDWELSIPVEMTQIRPGSWMDAATGALFPIKIYAPNLSRMEDIAQKEAVAAAALNGVQGEFEKSEATKMIDRAREWQRKRDYVLQVWLPVAQSQGLDPQAIQLVFEKLEDEKPKGTKSMSFDRILQMLGG